LVLSGFLPFFVDMIFKYWGNDKLPQYSFISVVQPYLARIATFWAISRSDG
jgi:hypothetical protein